MHMATGNWIKLTSAPLNSVVWHGRRWRLIKPEIYVYQFSYRWIDITCTVCNQCLDGPDGMYDHASVIWSKCGLFEQVWTVTYCALCIQVVRYHDTAVIQVSTKHERHTIERYHSVCRQALGRDRFKVATIVYMYEMVYLFSGFE